MEPCGMFCCVCFIPTLKICEIYVLFCFSLLYSIYVNISIYLSILQMGLWVLYFWGWTFLYIYFGVSECISVSYIPPNRIAVSKGTGSTLVDTINVFSKIIWWTGSGVTTNIFYFLVSMTCNLLPLSMRRTCDLLLLIVT